MDGFLGFLNIQNVQVSLLPLLLCRKPFSGLTWKNGPQEGRSPRRYKFKN